jgi:hypothetical protein
MRRSLQSLLPSILVSFGCFIILLAGDMPLFEWQISQLVTDFPSTYDVRVDSSPWRAYLGDSLDDGTYIFRNIWVEQDGKICFRKDFHFEVMRSRNDKTLERILNIESQSFEWLFQWGYIEFLLSVIYIWFFSIWYERRAGCFFAFVLTGIAVFIFLNVSQIARVLASPFRLFVPSDFGQIICSGAVTFTAALSRIHYEALLVLLVGILLELGAVGVIVTQVMKAKMHGNESPKLEVG